MDEYGGMSIQRMKDLHEAQNLALPFSNDFYKPTWAAGSKERAKNFKSQLTRLVTQDYTVQEI